MWPHANLCFGSYAVSPAFRISPDSKRPYRLFTPFASKKRSIARCVFSEVSLGLTAGSGGIQ